MILPARQWRGAFQSDADVGQGGLPLLELPGPWPGAPDMIKQLPEVEALLGKACLLRQYIARRVQALGEGVCLSVGRDPPR